MSSSERPGGRQPDAHGRGVPTASVSSRADVRPYGATQSSPAPGRDRFAERPVEGQVAKASAQAGRMFRSEPSNLVPQVTLVGGAATGTAVVERPLERPGDAASGPASGHGDGGGSVPVARQLPPRPPSGGPAEGSSVASPVTQRVATFQRPQAGNLPPQPVLERPAAPEVASADIPVIDQAVHAPGGPQSIVPLPTVAKPSRPPLPAHPPQASVRRPAAPQSPQPAAPGVVPVAASSAAPGPVRPREQPSALRPERARPASTPQSRPARSHPQAPEDAETGGGLYVTRPPSQSKGKSDVRYNDPWDVNPVRRVRAARERVAKSGRPRLETATYDGPATRSAKDFGREIAEWAGIFVVALVVALTVQAVAVQAFLIPSESMYPLLTQGDRVIVNKVAYKVGDIERRDVVVFKRPPGEDATDENGKPITHLIKRVIGVPGDVIEAKDCQIVVNGVPQEEQFVAQDACTQDVTKTTVPPGQLWVMGDNRENSQDSRFFGTISQKLVVGRADFLVWPLGSFRHIN